MRERALTSRQEKREIKLGDKPSRFGNLRSETSMDCVRSTFGKGKPVFDAISEHFLALRPPSFLLLCCNSRSVDSGEPLETSQLIFQADSLGQ